MKLTKVNFDKVSNFIRKNARELDRQFFYCYFENGSSKKVLQALGKYQNDDGGFGYGLESDFITPSSSAIATTIAIQYMEKIETSKENKMLRKAIDYLSESFSQGHQRWRPVPDDVNNFPHAPWWHIDEKTGMCQIEQSWENPTAEVLGYLQKYKNSFSPELLENLTRKAIDRLQKSKSMWEHNIYCYMILYKHISEDKNIQMKSKIDELIKLTVNENEEDWKTKYVPKPLNFVDSPKSPYYELLADSVEKNLNFLIETIDSGDAWYPTWKWERYEKEWEKARIEWAGKIAVENLMTLDKFSKVEN